jgi:hypothetical protein
MLERQASGNRQHGFSTIAILMAILIGFFALTALVRVVPVYIDNFALSQVIGSLGDREAARRIESERDVREYLKKRVQMENLDAVNVADMDIVYGNELLTVDYEYEVRTLFMGNVDVVLKFEHHHETRVP